MQFQIEVPTNETQERSYTSADGKDHKYLVQQVYLHIPGKKYPAEFPRRVPNGQKPLTAGMYVPDYSDMWLNYAFNRVEMPLGKLVALAAQVKG
jgi:hypothetical protein